MSKIQKYMNIMQKPYVEKVVVNISVGKSGLPLQRAFNVLEQLTEQKPIYRKAKKTVRDWGIRQNEPIACIVTLRGLKAKTLLKKAFGAVNKQLSKSCFDVHGNFSFGISEHIEIPGTRYDPQLGIVGMDVSVTIEKPGYRVKRRHRLKSKIGKKQRVRPEEAMKYVQEEYDIEVQGGSIE